MVMGFWECLRLREAKLYLGDLIFSVSLRSGLVYFCRLRVFWLRETSGVLSNGVVVGPLDS